MLTPTERFAAARRSGGACVLVDKVGQVIFGLYGPCPDAFPIALRAELRAVVMLLRHALPPLTIHVDCKAVVDGWTRGQEWTEASSRPDADLWRELWRLADDIGPGVQLQKCKGHATEADVQHGRATAAGKTANDNADYYAGCGVTIAEHQRPNQHMMDGYKEAQRWYRWLATLPEDLPKDTQAVAPTKAPAPPAPAGAAEEKRSWDFHAHRPLQLLLERDGWT